jgi:hypothetical protein
VLLAGAEADAAWRRAQELVVIVLAAQDLGSMSEAVRIAAAYAKTREAFGRPIGGFQAMKHSLVDVYVLEEQLRCLVWLAAWSGDVDTASARLYGSAAGAYARDAFERRRDAYSRPRRHRLHLGARRSLVLAAGQDGPLPDRLGARAPRRCGTTGSGRVHHA